MPEILFPETPLPELLEVFPAELGKMTHSHFHTVFTLLGLKGNGLSSSLIEPPSQQLPHCLPSFLKDQNQTWRNVEALLLSSLLSPLSSLSSLFLLRFMQFFQIQAFSDPSQASVLNES